MDTPQRQPPSQPSADPASQPGPARPARQVAVGTSTGTVAPVQPLDVTGVRTVGVGTLLFLVAGVVLLFFRGWLEDTDREWWLWTCVAGFGLGVFGYDYCRRRARHHAHH